MNESFLNRNHSSEGELATRVKVREPKKTVGITISQNLLQKARNHNLNISRITEQALSSILDYLETQTIKPSSNLLTEGSSQEETSRAGRSVWYDRRLRKAEAAGSNPARSTPIWV